MQLTNRYYAWRNRQEKAEEVSVALAKRIVQDPEKPAKFKLLSKACQQQAVVGFAQEGIERDEYQVGIILANDMTATFMWSFEGPQTVLTSLHIKHSFSGDPGGPTSPIGISESFQMTEESLSDINKEHFFSAED